MKIWNDDPEPSVRTKTVDQILDHIRFCARITASGH